MTNNIKEITLSAPPSGGVDFALVDRCLNAILQMDISVAERRLLSFLVGREEDALQEASQSQHFNTEVDHAV